MQNKYKQNTWHGENTDQEDLDFDNKADSEAYMRGIDDCSNGVKINQNPYIKIEIINGFRVWQNLVNEHKQAREWLDGYISSPGYK